MALLRQQLRDGPNVRARISQCQGAIAWRDGDHHAALAYYEQTLEAWPDYADTVNKIKEQVAAEDQAAQDEHDRTVAASQANDQVATFRAELSEKVTTIQSEQNAVIAGVDDRLQTYLASNTNSDTKLGVVNPGMFVTRAQAKSASKNLERLQRLRDNLTAKLAEVQKWENGLRRDDKEFEAMRLEAQHDLAWEFVDHLPVAEGLEGLKGYPPLKGVNIDKVKAAYEAVKGLLETERGISAKDDREKIEKIVSGNRELRNAMIDAAGLDEKSKALLGAVSKIISMGAQTAIVASANNMSTRDKLKTVMTFVTIAEPLWGLSVLGEDLAERGVQYHEAGLALDSLHEAQSSNWNAQRFLKEKINRLNDEAKEERFIIDKYQMANNRN